MRLRRMTGESGDDVGGTSLGRAGFDSLQRWAGWDGKFLKGSGRRTEADP